MGELDKVAVLQLDYRGLLGRKPGAGGATIEEEYLETGSEAYGIDSVVNMAVSIHQFTEDPDQVEILKEAIGILDHLDTLGMEVRHKR